MNVRLQKLIAGAGIASRRASEKLILEGRVTVNGETVRVLGARADPAVDDVRVDGSRLKVKSHPRYVLLNKPRGFVTTRADPEGRPTVLDLVRPGEYLYPVGRLDYDSEGLLLLTNDGELAARLMHPRHKIERVYQARVRGVPDGHDLGRLSRGLIIDGRRTAPASARVLETGRGRAEDQSLIEVTLREGRTRQVRKMCEAVGHPVLRLKRVRIGPIADPELRARQYRELTRHEIARLKAAVGL